MNSFARAQAHWLGQQLRPALFSYIASIALLVLSSLMFLVDPLLLKWLIDVVLPARNLRVLAPVAAGFFTIYILRLAFSAAATVINSRTTQALTFRIRVNVLEHMNRLSAGYHDSTPLGDRLYRMEQDVDQIAELGSNTVPYALQTLLNSIFVVSTMFLLNARMTAVALPLVPVFFLVRRWFEPRLQRAADAAQDTAGRESNFLQEHLASIVQVQLLNRQKDQTRTFCSRARARMAAANRRTLMETLFGLTWMIVVALGTAAMLAYGGYEVVAGALTIGGLVAFYSYVARLFDPVHAAVNIYAQLIRLGASLRRILEVLERPPEIVEAPNPQRLAEGARAQLGLEDVSFRYRDESPVLDCLTFSVAAGQKLALVGASGTGKSTIAKLVARLYDVTSGSIRIGEVDVQQVELESLRKNVCYVMQEPILFDLTLKENLLLGNSKADAKELCHAVEIAQLIDLLARLPRGWDTPIGSRGNLLSGGERQRLALARAILQRPRIMLLDESTCAVDLPTERDILYNLAHSLADTTMLFISHRLSSLSWVDRIVVLNRGTVEEQGTHSQLLRAQGTYSRLFTTMSRLS